MAILINRKLKQFLALKAMKVHKLILIAVLYINCGYYLLCIVKQTITCVFPENIDYGLFGLQKAAFIKCANAGRKEGNIKYWIIIRSIYEF